jgi:hypothetical protein
LDAFRKPDKPIRGAAAPTDAFQAEVHAVRAGPDKDIPHLGRPDRQVRQRPTAARPTELSAASIAFERIAVSG